MQDTKVLEKEPLITINELAGLKQKHLMRKLLIMVIVVNLIVLLSIILFT
jgi:hypothetical protein